MRINPISNTNQKQQSFGAMPGRNFSNGLAEFVTDAFGSREEAQKFLSQSDNIIPFINGIRDIKLKSSTRGKFEPVIDITRIDKDNFRISTYLSGIEDKESGLWLNPKETLANSNPLKEILKWAKVAVCEFQDRHMPLMGQTVGGNVEGTTKAITEWIYQT